MHLRSDMPRWLPPRRTGLEMKHLGTCAASHTPHSHHAHRTPAASKSNQKGTQALPGPLPPYDRDQRECGASILTRRRPTCRCRVGSLETKRGTRQANWWSSRAGGLTTSLARRHPSILIVTREWL
jgi:hypothetical protein